MRRAGSLPNGKYIFSCLVLFVSLIVLGQTKVFAQDESEEKGGGVGSIMITPTRIVFEGRTRSAQVKVINQGTGEGTFRISFKDMRMTEDGQYEDVKEGFEQSAKSLIRYSPRQVVLKPGESQTVRLLLRKKKGLAEGEYRSHMLFQSLPDETAGADIEDLASDDGKVKLKLFAIFGVSIPVIVRNGKGSAEVKMADLKVNAPKTPDSSKTLSVRLNRQGSQSVFGDIHAKFIPSNGGEEVEVGRISGIAVYFPNKSRVISVELNVPEGTKLANGQVQVAYTGYKNDSKILAASKLNIP